MSGFPNDVGLLKVHPAIGIARLSSNPNYFVFGEQPDSYKSEVVVDGGAVSLIKRQAVRFSLASYRSNGAFVRDYTPEELDDLGIDIVWKAKVANRKIAEALGRDAEYEIHAEGKSDVAGGELLGTMGPAADFDLPGGGLPMGEIGGDGLFLPGQVSVVARENGAIMPAYGGIRTADFADSTGDGVISVELRDRATGNQILTKVLPAWIIISPPDFAPDQTDEDIPEYGDRPNLDKWLVKELNVPAAANMSARAFDRKVLEHCTSDFAPGIEACFGELKRRVPGELPAIFYKSAVTKGVGDVRLDPTKTKPGDITYYLCSPWQYDFRACSCGFWVAQKPDIATRDDDADIVWEGTDTIINWLRQNVAETGEDVGARKLLTNPSFVEFVERLGILRARDGKIVETERDSDIPLPGGS